MTFNVGKAICPVNKQFDQINSIQLDPVKVLPDELVLPVFSHLNLATLGTICLVSKEWQRLASEPNLWKIGIYREIAFGNDKWAQCFGEDIVKDENREEEFSSLPAEEFIEDCKKFKRVFPEIKPRDFLMLVRLPKTLNGQLTMKSLGELAKKYFPNSDTGYWYIKPAILNVLGDKSVDKSRWVVMTKDVLPGSRTKSYTDQQDMVANLAQKVLIGYEIPGTLEASACILSQFFDSSIRLFNDNPWTFTRCKDNVHGGAQTVVGGFAPAGLFVSRNPYADDYIGVAALRKF